MNWPRKCGMVVTITNSLSYTPTAVSRPTECSCKAHLPAEVFWSHHWCTGLSPLAADTRVRRVQDHSADLESHEWYGTVISGTLSVSLTCLADGLCTLQSPIVWQYQLLNCLRSAAERFLFPVLKRGTNYPEEITSATSLSTFRHLKTFLFRKSFPDIIADWHFSGHCGNLN